MEYRCYFASSGGLYIFGVLITARLVGGSLTEALREWGRVHYQTLKPKAAFIFSFIVNSVGRGWRVIV